MNHAQLVAVGIPTLALLAAIHGGHQATAEAQQPTQTPYPIEDQASCDSAPKASVAVGRQTWKAQTFEAGVSGRLVHVDLPGHSLGESTTLHITGVANEAPSGPQLGQSTVACGTAFTFDPGIPVEAGNDYALVLSSSGDLGGYQWDYSHSRDCYPRGHPFTSTDGGVRWSRDIVDFHFTTFVLPNDPGGTAAPPLPTICPPRPTPGPALTRRTTFVISLPTGRSDSEHVLDMSYRLASLLERATMHHGYADPSARPYLAYDVYQDRVIREDQMPPRLPSGVYDVGHLYEKHELCALAQRGEIDEVWVWDGGQGGLPEWAVNGPEFRFPSGSGVPDCGRQITTMVFNNSRELDVAMESYGHRLESLFAHYFPCDMWTETWPWSGWPAHCDGRVSDRTGFVARPFAGNRFVGACGDIHTPPNIRDDTPYGYYSRDIAMSICPDWRRDGTAKASVISCEDWGCSHVGYMIWWMQNLPGARNTSSDRDGNTMPNWWSYLFGQPPGASPTPTASDVPPPVATPSPTPSPSTAPSRQPVYIPAALR